MWPADIYVKLTVGANASSAAREHMSVYRQKAAGSDDFICILYDESPIGQHMIDFITVSTDALPPLVAKMKRNLALIQAQNFDHHLVPVYLENTFDLYSEVRGLHCWWASSMPLGKLWSDFNDYSFFAQHPSPYLIETYDEVDRLMSEEFYWRTVCDQLEEYLQWFEFYVVKLAQLNDALACCLDSNLPGSLTSLSNIQRAFLFRSFFDD